MNVKYLKIIPIFACLIFYAVPAFSRIGVGGSYSLTKEPCVEKSYGVDGYIYDRLKRYHCYGNKTVHYEEFLNKKKFYDRRGRVVMVFENNLSGEESWVNIKKTYYSNGQLRSEGTYGHHSDMAKDRVTYYYEDGGIMEDWFFDDYKFIEVKYYDKEGNGTKHLKDGDQIIRKAWIQWMLDDEAETNIRDMAMATQVYAESHDGEYFSITPSFRNKILGYSEFAFQHCNSTWGAYSYTCTNTVDGYEYKAVPVNEQDYKGSKIITATTGEIYTEHEM